MSEPKPSLPFNSAPATSSEAASGNAFSQFPLSYWRNLKDDSDEYHHAMTLFSHAERLADDATGPFNAIKIWQEVLRLSSLDMGTYLFPLTAEWARTENLILRYEDDNDAIRFENQRRIRAAEKFSKKIDIHNVHGEDLLSFCKNIGVHPADILFDKSHYRNSILQRSPLPRAIVEACVVILKDENFSSFDKEAARDALDAEHRSFHAQIMHSGSPYHFAVGRFLTFFKEKYYSFTDSLKDPENEMGSRWNDETRSFEIVPYRQGSFRQQGIANFNAMTSAEDIYHMILMAMDDDIRIFDSKIKSHVDKFKSAERAFNDCYRALFDTIDDNSYQYAMDKMRAIVNNRHLDSVSREERIFILTKALQTRLADFTFDGKLRISRGDGEIIRYEDRAYIGFQAITNLMATSFVDGLKAAQDLDIWQEQRKRSVQQFSNSGIQYLFGNEARNKQALPPEQWRFVDNMLLMTFGLDYNFMQPPQPLLFGKKTPSPPPETPRAP